ncbi:MAG: xylulokinase [Ancrocorticia sp.]|uniref:xylulokinase n=1 Tax=Ancrocorticia sp. TaxID=2593684 RepID=UPI003F9002BE
MSDTSSTTQAIADGRTYLGIEFGSTRIKACLITAGGDVIATGIHDWENKLVDGHWSYSLEEIAAGLQGSYSDLVSHVKKTHGIVPTTYGAIGVSAMMHGLLAFDDQDNLLIPFRTWRDTYTGVAAGELTELLGQNMPLRWSASHIYQAIIDDEPFIKDLAFATTLAGYVHFKLTGQRVLGVGDASGMFPIDSATGTYDASMLRKADALMGSRAQIPPLADLLPEVLGAGADAGTLSAEGAAFLDVSGKLQSGVSLCPPEGDAGTGMVATNAVRQRTGNVSAGTSIFSMAVLEKPLAHVHPELDLVATPSGDPVAMVHCNNGATELSVWVELFASVADAMGAPSCSKDDVYQAILARALDAEPDAGGIMAFNFVSGEPVVGASDGRPLIVRAPEARLTLPNLMRAELYSVFAALAAGMEILAQEDVALDFMNGHGGIFRTKGVAQQVLADAINIPVRVSESAGEGGAWGIALLASYLKEGDGKALADFLDEDVFAGTEPVTVNPDAAGSEGFKGFLNRFRRALPIQEVAAKAIN